MNEALTEVARFFEADGWPHEHLEDPERLRSICHGQHGEWICNVLAVGDPGAIVAYSSCPFEVPAERRGAVGELLLRATWGLVLGTFEMDLEDGEIRYRTGRSLDGAPIGEGAIHSLLYENVLAMDRYLPAIEAVAWQDVEPEAAILAVEG